MKSALLLTVIALAALLLSGCCTAGWRERSAFRLKTPDPYTVKVLPRGGEPEFKSNWDDPLWSLGNTVRLSNWYRPSEYWESEVDFTMLHDREQLFWTFRAKDQYFFGNQLQNNSAIFRDTCAEVFMQLPNRGYFNFEVSISGAVYAAYHEFNNYNHEVCLSPEDIKQITVKTSHGGLVIPEREEPGTWQIEVRLPLSLLEKYAGPIGRLSGQEWRCNFYHSADGSTHPRWLSWYPLERLSFHLPESFGPVRFE